MNAILFLVFLAGLFGLILHIAAMPAKLAGYAYLTTYLLITYALGPYISNQTSRQENPYFILPQQSSLFTFTPTVYDSSGSGENWRYGQDWINYYYSGPAIISLNYSYVFTPRNAAKSCIGFNATDFRTWCAYEGR